MPTLLNDLYTIPTENLNAAQYNVCACVISWWLPAHMTLSYIFLKIVGAFQEVTQDPECEYFKFSAT